MPRRLPGPRAQAHAVHRGLAAADGLHVLTLGRLEDGVDEDRLADRMLASSCASSWSRYGCPRPSTLGSMMSRAWRRPRARSQDIVERPGELSALMRVHSPCGRSRSLGHGDEALRAASLARPEWRPRGCPSTTSTWPISSPTGRDLLVVSGTKCMRSRRTAVGEGLRCGGGKGVSACGRADGGHGRSVFAALQQKSHCNGRGPESIRKPRVCRVSSSAGCSTSTALGPRGSRLRTGLHSGS